MAQLVSTAKLFTRPADTTAYAATGDLVANSTTAANVVPLNFRFRPMSAKQLQIRRFRLIKSTVTVTAAAFRLWLFTVAPTFATAGDNGAIASDVSGAASFLGQLDVTAMVAMVDGAVGVGIPTAGTEVIWADAIGVDATGHLNLYGFLEARGAYAPGDSETFTASIDCLPIGTGDSIH